MTFLQTAAFFAVLSISYHAHAQVSEAHNPNKMASIDRISISTRLGATPSFEIGSRGGSRRGLADESSDVFQGIMTRIADAYIEQRPLEVCVRNQKSRTLVAYSECGFDIDDSATVPFNVDNREVKGSLVQMKYVRLEIGFVPTASSVPRLQIWADPSTQVNKGRFWYPFSGRSSEALLSEIASKLASSYPYQDNSITLCVAGRSILPEAYCR
jgi:hypothetical protein